MKNKFMMVLCLIIMAVSMNAQNFSNSGVKCTTQTAEQLINMIKAASKGIMPTEQEWEYLFNLDGYKSSFGIRKDGKEWKENIKNAFFIQFDANRKEELDSIVNTNLSFESPHFHYFVLNFYMVKNNIDEMSRFMKKLDMDKIIKKADKMARKHLPKNVNLSKAKFNDIHFVLWDGEARAWKNGVYIDLNLALFGGENELVRTLAHEFHHVYMRPILMSKYKQDITDFAIIALYRNQLEGTADMISKPNMPTDKMGIYGETIKKTYNDDYLSTPLVLQEMDSLTCQFLSGKITKKQYRKVMNCAHFEGHTTGDYMVFLIRDQLGKKAAIECFGDFAEFVHRYNKAAQKANSYVFSDTFVKHIEKECSKMMEVPKTNNNKQN